MMTRGIWTGCLCLAVLAGCGGHDDGGSDTGTETPQLADTPLSGKVEGQEWTFASGMVRGSLAKGGDAALSVDLFGEVTAQCEFGGFDVAYVSVDVPTVVGEYGLSDNLLVTFWSESGFGYITAAEIVSVQEVTETQVTAAIYARYDDDFEVNGIFEVPVCE